MKFKAHRGTSSGGDLQRFGPDTFQDLVSTLVIAEFGSAAQRMGKGPDGGRDVVMVLDGDGRSDVPYGWSGYTVFQAKHKSSLGARPTDDATWLRAQVREEIAMWANSGSKRKRIPDTIVFVTNVPLTPSPQSGGYDSVLGAIRSHLDGLATRALPDGPDRDEYDGRVAKLLKTEWRVWDANQLSALIDRHESVRRAFPAFWTAADVFAFFREESGRVWPEDLGVVLRSHARTALISEGNVYFDEAGAVDGAGHPLHEMFVDLPVLNAGTPGSGTLLGRILSRSERMLRPGLSVMSRDVVA